MHTDDTVVVYTILDFCRAFRLSRTGFYKLRVSGRGPRTMNLGGKVLITKQAATDWVREREAASAATAEPVAA
jgi:hypothetical protein